MKLMPLMIFIFSQLELSAQTPVATNSLATNSISSANPPPIPSTVATASSAEDDPEFLNKLKDLLERSDKTIKLLREQITQSANAPFLPDLYVQLADLLSQKANALYYIQMEKYKNLSESRLPDKASSPAVKAQEEAVYIYKILLRDFPHYPKRREATFRMALALKSIDDKIEFTKICHELIQNHPGTEEAAKARLLLGQEFLDRQLFQEAVDILTPAMTSTLIYEASLAKYRVGLAYLALDRQADALQLFEQVIREKNLTEQRNPYELSLRKKHKKSDIRREALIDSLRAYTQVHQVNPDPVAYYSKLAPSEFHFQEVLEKLSIRYINMKQHSVALGLLRTLSLRVPDVQKVLAIYQHVLGMIPVEERGQIPSAEVAFVLEKLKTWLNFYKASDKIRNDFTQFFEKQTRELGTSAHQNSKTEVDETKKVAFLRRAQAFYEVYLNFFAKDPHAAKIALDLADVHYHLGAFLECGDLYLRISDGEFGVVSERKAALQNSILCLQKKPPEGFYENIRAKALLIRGLSTYIASDPQAARDPEVRFSLAKAEFEQNLPGGLENLFKFIQEFKNSPRAGDAGEIILSHFQTKGDFQNLDLWAARIQDLRLANADLSKKITDIRTQAKTRVFQEKVEAVAGFDEFAQGKSYLIAAVSSTDAVLANQALQEALKKSQAEKDLETFFEVARVMAERETDPRKRAEVLRAQAQELLKLTRYAKAVEVLKRILQDSQVGPAVHREVFGQLATIALALRDLSLLEDVLKSPHFAQSSSQIHAQMRTVVISALEAPLSLPVEFQRMIFALTQNEDVLSALYRAQMKLDPAFRAEVEKRLQTRCQTSSRMSLCRWGQLKELDKKKLTVLTELSKPAAGIEDLQAKTKTFQGLVSNYVALEGTGDAQIETILSLRQFEIYRAFAEHLKITGAALPDFQSVLAGKADESLKTAEVYRQRCREIQARAASGSKSSRVCETMAPKSPEELLAWGALKTPPTRMPDSPKLQRLQESVYYKGQANDFLLLATEYYQLKQYSESAAVVAQYLSSHDANDPEMNGLLGCNLLGMGYEVEAQFRLEKAEGSARGAQCRASLVASREGQP